MLSPGELFLGPLLDRPRSIAGGRGPALKLDATQMHTMKRTLLSTLTKMQVYRASVRRPEASWKRLDSMMEAEWTLFEALHGACWSAIR